MKYDFVCYDHKNLREVMSKGLWGVINEEEKIIIPIVFDRIPLYYIGGYYICEKENKQGVYDITGKEILPVNSDAIFYLGDNIFCSVKDNLTTIHDLENSFSFDLACNNTLPFSKEYLIFENNELQGLVDKKGKVIIEAQYKSISKVDIFAVAIDAKNKQHVYNLEKKKWIITGEYTKIKIVAQNYICVKNRKNRYGFIDFDGVEKIECKYTDIGVYKALEGITIVWIKNKCGIVDASANEIIPVMYDKIIPMNCGTFAVMLEKKMGILNRSNQIKLPIKYEDISEKGNKFISIRKNGKKGLLDLEYKEVIPPEYDDIYLISSDMAKVSRGYNRYGLYNLKNGKILCDLRYSEINSFSEGYAVVRNADWKYGYINEEGKEVIQCKYENAREFCNGFAVVSKGCFEYGYINKTGDEVTDFIYYHAGDADKDGTAAVYISYKRPNELWQTQMHGKVILRRNRYGNKV